MAKQRGLQKYTGLMDELVHYRTKHGYIVRRKGSISKERRASAPEFEKLRNSSLTLAYASRVGKLMRLGVRQIMGAKEPGDTNTRLSTAIRKVAKLDTAVLPGMGRILPENAIVLKHFEWNTAARVGNSIRADYKVHIERETGLVSIRMPGLNAAEVLKQFAGATHMEIILGVTAVDYEGDRQVSTFDGSGPLLITEKRPVEVLLECEIPKEVGALIVIGIGIQSYEMNGGALDKLQSGSGYMVLEVMV